MTAEITDAELQAFIDDQLDTEGRIDVLTHLLDDAPSCRRTLLDLRSREVMRALAERAALPSDRLVLLAKRLQRRAEPRRAGWRHAAIAGTAAMLAAWPLALAVMPSSPRPGRPTLPSYYEEALEARRVALLRQAMVSQVETPDLDPKDIRTATRIRIPVLPHGWQIADVQLFPSDFGPAVQVSIRSAQGGSLFLFATHADTGAPGQPKVNRIGGTDLVAWSAGGNTYVLAGARLRGRLIDMADDLADNRFS
ncbi:anti-sigma factor family protein [Sphingomonas aerophila]|uniref:Anti-sigma factor n=1 Tax=Sphingomonas aerophila TaxID=1344948 RepID=A0A7W9BDX5_9SPHN|nr:hypothetical protein [Sphingomonas aerophila]MBB5715213.1 hypothetical protein [Sphingomonas aerophila]